MAARIDYKASVSKDLKNLDRNLALRLLTRIERALLSEGRKGKALSGKFAGLYSLRVGDYRIIYVPIRDGFLVLRIPHRRDVYKKGRPDEE